MCLTKKGSGAMNANQQARWNEIRIFYLMDSMQEIRGREDELYLLAEYLASFGTFNLHALLRHMAEFRRSPHTHPSRDEVLTLAALAGRRYPELRKYIGVPKSTFYDIVKRIDTEVYVHPCLAPESRKDIAGFLETYDKVQEGTFHAGRSGYGEHVADV